MYSENDTPPQEATLCPSKTRADLEWDRLLAALADRAQSHLGQRAAASLPFAPDRESALRALGEVREAKALDDTADPLPIGALPDAGPALESARIGSALDAEDLRAVLAILAAARTLRRYIDARSERAPLLALACATDPSLDDLERTLDRTFEPDGSISDRASPELARLRSERRNVRDRLLRKLAELIAKHADLLQDSFHTERDGRYVLPIRADAHERFPGIVHGESQSGATVFVEPRALVDQGNRLKMLDAQIDRAERAILAALSRDVAEQSPAIEAACAALAHADLRAAAARLARDLHLTFPDVLPESEPFSAHLQNARHPLLLLDGVSVVPSDIDARAREVLVVSGPNAGGKTIALKTLGLAALMLRAGLPVPARDGSRLSLWTSVLTDVGDEQNLHKNLSTFSAHVRNLAAILESASPGALVLLDEVCGGTDPREGEALATAILDSLASRGAAVACTTHYEGLKAVALRDPRFKNASVGFDLTTMSPTFRLAIGVPGPSSALAVARRFGIPGLLIERAESFLSRETVAFEEMVQELTQGRHDLDRARASLARDTEQLAARQRDLESEMDRLRTRDRAALTEESEDLRAALRRARDDLRAAHTRLRTARTESDLREAQKLIDPIAQKVSLGGELAPPPADEPERPPVTTSALKPGMRVHVPRLRADADLLEILSNGQLRVAAGPLKLTLRPDEVRAALANSSTKSSFKGSSGKQRGGGGGAGGGGTGAARKQGSGIVLDAAADPDVPIQTSENTVDLRGLRAHEATSMAEQFLDRMLGSGRRVAFLIHGHGTGAVREAIRQSMRSSPYVDRSRPGEQREGGDGVTVVWLR
ncbi:MAG: Smr/MutS family protein [Polyangiaceae bacterium]